MGKGGGDNHAIRGITPWKEASKSLFNLSLSPVSPATATPPLLCLLSLLTDLLFWEDEQVQKKGQDSADTAKRFDSTHIICLNIPGITTAHVSVTFGEEACSWGEKRFILPRFWLKTGTEARTPLSVQSFLALVTINWGFVVSSRDLRVFLGFYSNFIVWMGICQQSVWCKSKTRECHRGWDWRCGHFTVGAAVCLLRVWEEGTFVCMKFWVSVAGL